MRQQDADSYTWVIREVHEEARQVRSFVMEAVSERPPFISGQYLTVRLPGFEPAEGKSYSISSSEEDPFIRLTVKEAGPFSRALYGHVVGDTLTTSAPYGFFYPEEGEAQNLVFIAGGIGITPCMGILETLAREGYPKDMTLFYSNRTQEDITFQGRLEALASSLPRLRVLHHITREPVDGTPYREGRIVGDSVLHSLTHHHTDADYFVCGSIDFTKNLWKELRNVGVPTEKIYTEGFY
jgi:ferredoxin-NADP reductase